MRQYKKEGHSNTRCGISPTTTHPPTHTHTHAHTHTHTHTHTHIRELKIAKICVAPKILLTIKRSILHMTAYVVRREGYVLTRVCPSVCLHLVGYPSQVQLGGTHLGYLLVRLGWGVPCWGGTPLWVPPVRPGWGVPLLGGYPIRGTPPQVPPSQTWPGGYPAGGTPPWVPPVRPGWGVPHLG